MAINRLLAIALGTFLTLPCTLALPNIVPPEEGRIEGRQCTGCPPIIPHKNYCPKVDWEELVTGEPWQIGASVPAGTTFNFAKTCTVGSSWTIGASLGCESLLNLILSFERIVGMSLGLEGSITHSVENSVQLGAEFECPEGGGWSCSMMIYEGFAKIHGHNDLMLGGQTCDAGVTGKEGEWEALVPRKDQSGSGFWTPKICNCCNLIGNGDPGHPAKCCKDPCIVPPADLKGSTRQKAKAP